MIQLRTNAARPGRRLPKVVTTTLSAFILMVSIQALSAGNARWAPNPSSSDWNTSVNWVPMTIPNGPADRATFGVSTQTDVSLSPTSSSTEVSEITFDPGAGPYVISLMAISKFTGSFYVSGAGIINNSGRVQNFVITPVSMYTQIDFLNGASAGDDIQFTNNGGVVGVPGGIVSFGDTSSAGNAIIINNGSASGSGGGTTFFAGASSADRATITNNANGGLTQFLDKSSADNSTITNNGGNGPGELGSATYYKDRSNTSNAILIANGGANGGDGGAIHLADGSSIHGTAQVQIFGNGKLDLRSRNGGDATQVTIGSLEGDGTVLVGISNFTVGSRNRNTTFSGMILGGDETGTSGLLTKIGTGILTLSGTNRVAGANVNAGKLEVDGTLTYLTIVNEGGTLAGSGTIGGVSVERLGIVAPGDQRTLHIGDGGYTQNSGGVLRVGVAGTEPEASDHLEISGTARLDGTLEVRFLNGFLPLSGQVFKPLKFGGMVIGSFAQIIFPDLRAGFQFQTELVKGHYQVTALNDGVAATGFLNISTRVQVGTGDKAVIGGFIVTGSVPKRVIIRALGPSLAQAGVPGALADPTLELRDSAGGLLFSNDNWMESAQVQEIIDSGIPPSDEHEAAIVATLAPGNYTAVMRGVSNSTGIGIVEVYDLAQDVPARLANISTRGLVETGDNVMIGGFIAGNQAMPVMVRALGPSLTQSGVPNALADPTVELHNAQGTVVAFNDDWEDTDAASIEATGIPPVNEKESAILATLPSGNYTAIVRGHNGAIGVGLIEVYDLH